MVGDDEINFPHKLLLTNRHLTNLRKVFANYLSTDIKLSKTQISKMIQSRGFLGRFLDPLLKKGLPLMKNVAKTLAKSVNILAGKGIKRAGEGVVRTDYGNKRQDHKNKMDFYSCHIL